MGFLRVGLSWEDVEARWESVTEMDDSALQER